VAWRIRLVPWQKKQGAYAKPWNVVTLVERGGRARSIKVEDLSIATLDAVLSQIDPASRLHTDQAQHYKSLGGNFAKHETVNHTEKEYGRGDVTTNTVEGFFSIFKRGMTGVYQHCDEKHYSAISVSVRRGPPCRWPLRQWSLQWSSIGGSVRAKGRDHQRQGAAAALERRREAGVSNWTRLRAGCRRLASRDIPHGLALMTSCARIRVAGPG
jgi:hypothetical protein